MKQEPSVWKMVLPYHKISNSTPHNRYCMFAYQENKSVIFFFSLGVLTFMLSSDHWDRPKQNIINLPWNIFSISFYTLNRSGHSDRLWRYYHWLIGSCFSHFCWRSSKNFQWHYLVFCFFFPFWNGLIMAFWKSSAPRFINSWSWSHRMTEGVG